MMKLVSFLLTGQKLMQLYRPLSHRRGLFNSQHGGSARLHRPFWHVSHLKFALQSLWNEIADYKSTCDIITNIVQLFLTPFGIFPVKKHNKTSPWWHMMMATNKFSLRATWGPFGWGGWWDTRLIVISRGEQKRKRIKKEPGPEKMSRSHPRLNYTRHTLFEYAFMYNTAGDIASIVYIHVHLFYPLAMGKQLKETRHKMYKPYTHPVILQGKQIPSLPHSLLRSFFPTHTATTWLHTNETVCGVDAGYSLDPLLCIGRKKDEDADTHTRRSLSWIIGAGLIIIHGLCITAEL